VLGVSILSLSTIWHLILELFPQCDIFFFILLLKNHWYETKLDWDDVWVVHIQSCVLQPCFSSKMATISDIRLSFHMLSLLCLYRFSSNFTILLGMVVWGSAFFLMILYPHNEVVGGYTGVTMFVRLSVCPSICRQILCRTITWVVLLRIY
jgi:hypothetical protein